MSIKVSLKFAYVLSLLIIIVIISNINCNSIHGGTFLALTGKDSVVLVSDSRFSSHKTGTILLGKYPRLCFRVGSKTIVGCFGLNSDVYALIHSLKQKLTNHYDDDFEPEQLSRVVSDLLYQNDFIISPMIIGLTKKNIPYICTMDGLGAQTISNSYSVLGTANEGLYALCESLYIPNLDNDELITLAERCYRLALQRDVMSGSDFRIITLTKDNIYIKDITNYDV